MPARKSQFDPADSLARDAARSPGPQNAVAAPHHVRHFLESVLCLALAVIVFRTFLVEGYMISTGSMAPTLLGFHKQVVCPSCGYAFAFGVSYQSDSPRAISGDGDETSDEADVSGHPPAGRQLCTCPNCGQRAIDISRVPRNQGDQLLVFREAYWKRLPRRWEVIVFRNPYETTQAYVKRLAGLPGETIEIREGDVYADGTLCRKDYATQKAVRIPVYDRDFEPADDPEWQPRWQPDRAWEPSGRGFVTEGGTSPPTHAQLEQDPSLHGLDLPPESADWEWVTYGNYVRTGGRHFTIAKVPILNEPLKWPDDLLPAQYDVKTRRLSVEGVMPLELRERLRAVSGDPQYGEAVDQLYHRSHFSPVTDDYGYNRPSHESGQNAVRDVMISLRLHVPDQRPAGDSPRQFAVDMTDGGYTFRLLWDFSSREIHLLADPELTPGRPPLRTAVMKTEGENAPCEIEMSLFDRQVTAAVNGEELFVSWPIEGPPPKNESPRFPVRFGSKGLEAKVDSLKLFRDVYYTTKGEAEPFSLKNDELYVLGDNSPVSLDSRRWKNGAVPLHLVLGKPFVVHLPSRQMKIRVGKAVRHIRIPDFPRVRYIR